MCRIFEIVYLCKIIKNYYINIIMLIFYKGSEDIFVSYIIYCLCILRNFIVVYKVRSVLSYKFIVRI